MGVYILRRLAYTIQRMARVAKSSFNSIDLAEADKTMSIAIPTGGFSLRIEQGSGFAVNERPGQGGLIITSLVPKHPPKLSVLDLRLGYNFPGDRAQGVQFSWRFRASTIQLGLPRIVF